jgi:membrane-associated phospholipid phosphatase
MRRAWLTAAMLPILAFAPRAASPQSGDAPAPAAVSEAPPPEGKASADGRRTTGRFLSNLGRNSLGLFSRDNLQPFLIGAGATGASAFFDDNCQRYFGPSRRLKWAGDMADFLGRPYVLTPIAGALYGIGRISHDHPRFRNGTYDIAQVFLINAAYTTAIKYASYRERPDGSNHLSFPSGHTSNAFAWATVANHYYGPKFGVPAYLLAGLIGVGRMEKNVHWLSDVVGGASIGYLVGRTVVRKDSEGLPEAHAHRLRIMPAPGATLGVLVSLDF